MTIEGVVESQIRAIFFAEVVPAIIAKAIAAAPFLGLPIIGPIFGLIVNWIAKRFYQEAKIRGVFLGIDLKEDKKRREYMEAVQKLRYVLKNTVDEDEMIKAEERYREKLRDLIRINTNSRLR